jgi:hypothetical protein
MSGNVKHPYLRFHLLTAILLMVAAGGMIRLNTNCWRERAGGGNSNYFRRAIYGWPFIAVAVNQTKTYDPPLDNPDPDFQLRDVRATAPREWYVSWTTLILNVVVCGAILLALGFFSEFLLRRRGSSG